MSNNVIIIDIAESYVRDKAATELLPQPAMGNMKPTNPEYAAKFAEKQAKIFEDAKENPLFMGVAKVRWVRYDAMSQTATKALTSTPEDFVKEVYGGKGSWNGAVLCGIHPTRHKRAILNTLLRTTPNISSGFLEAPAFNPWHVVSAPSEGEWPLAGKALGYAGVDSIGDTLELLRALGPAVFKLVRRYESA
jgi:hypothetical protein